MWKTSLVPWNGKSISCRGWNLIHRYESQNWQSNPKWMIEKHSALASSICKGLEAIKESQRPDYHWLLAPVKRDQTGFVNDQIMRVHVSQSSVRSVNNGYIRREAQLLLVHVVVVMVVWQKVAEASLLSPPPHWLPLQLLKLACNKGVEKECR